MSDIINPASQPVSDSFKKQNMAQEEIKQSFFSTDLITTEDVKKIEQHAHYVPQQIQNKIPRYVEKKSVIPFDMPLNERNLEEIEKELSILENLSPKQRSEFSDQLMQKEFMLIDPLIEQKFSQLASLSPEELKPLIESLKENINQTKKTANKLKEIDPRKADFILNTLQEISHIAHEYTSPEQQKKLIGQLEEQTTTLMKNHQLEPKIGNVLLLFLAFAKSQMDQNDKAMLAGIEQVKVKTAQLELNAEAIKDHANQSVQGRHISASTAVILTIAVFGASILALTGLGALAGMGLLGGIVAIGGGLMGSSTLALGVTATLITGLSAGSICIAAYKHPELPGLEWMTELGPKDKEVMHLQNLISFFNTQTQKINSQLGSTEKMFVENVSDRSSQLGQQSGQAITEFGQMMKAG